MDRKIYQVLGSFLLAFTLLLTACEKDTTNPTGGNPAPPANPGERNVYVVCEGSLGNGNASLFMQNLNSYNTYENVYGSTNGGLLGDVFQSMERIGERLFLCVNNSDRVVVIDAATRQKVGQIDIPKPRYILPVNSNKAYVSTLFSNKVYVIDPEQLIVDKIIEMPAQNPEGMMKLGNLAYICPWDTANNDVYVVDISTDQIVDSYEVAGYAPHSVLHDAENTVWVMAGNVTKGKKATLTRLAPGSDIVLNSFSFNGLEDPIKPILNKAGTELYYIGVDYNGAIGYNGIFKMGIDQTSIPSNPIIPAQQLQYFWGLGIDPVTGEIYVGDPKGFTQKGSVSVYTSSGELKRTFAVGVGPGNFLFDEL